MLVPGGLPEGVHDPEQTTVLCSAQEWRSFRYQGVERPDVVKGMVGILIRRSGLG
jgi:hypothetical protein